MTKRKAFQRHAIPEYWIIDPDAQVVEVWQRHDDRPAVIDGRLTSEPENAHAACDLDVPAFFAEGADGAPPG